MSNVSSYIVMETVRVDFKTQSLNSLYVNNFFSFSLSDLNAFCEHNTEFLDAKT